MEDGDSVDEDDDGGGEVPSYAQYLKMMGHIQKGHLSVNVNSDRTGGDEVCEFGPAQISDGGDKGGYQVFS